jgi:hypothetical protein
MMRLVPDQNADVMQGSALGNNNADAHDACERCILHMFFYINVGMHSESKVN